MSINIIYAMHFLQTAICVSFVSAFITLGLFICTVFHISGETSGSVDNHECVYQSHQITGHWLFFIALFCNVTSAVRPGPLRQNKTKQTLNL